MWHSLLVLSDDKKLVTSRIPEDFTMESELDRVGLDLELEKMGLQEYLVNEGNINLLIFDIKNGSQDDGIVIAECKDAELSIELDESKMTATMQVVGAYGGESLSGAILVRVISEKNIVKGISKKALQKIMLQSRILKPGETYSHVIAKGKPAVNGEDTSFLPMVSDVREQVRQPQELEDGTVDMRDLGETITVEIDDPLMKRTPPTLGEHGFTLLGDILAPTPGNDIDFKVGKGTKVSADNYNVLVATVAGMPWLESRGAFVDDTLCLKAVDITTGHVKFKGSVIINGDISPGMKVRATGTITVGGYIESADVQAHGDVIALRGIIGHQVADGEDYSCFVKAAGEITAKFAQFADVQAGRDINLTLHSNHSFIKSGKNVTVMDATAQHGLICGGEVRAANSVTTVNLGTTADTQTVIFAFTDYRKHKKQIGRFKDIFKAEQEKTMEVVRSELSLSKLPKEEKTDEMVANVAAMKKSNNEAIAKSMRQLKMKEEDLNQLLKNNTITVKNRIFPRVTMQFSEEVFMTKREYGPTRINFNEYEILLDPILTT
ncbi:MAG: DUF342 domain-containing protein [Aliivibrio sp.]|nr:DUF342 domain-containing protein [Aliivibrio sp.]